MEESQVSTEHPGQQSLEQDPSSTVSSFTELTNTQDGVVEVQDHPLIETPISSLAAAQEMQVLLAEMESLRRDFDAKVKYDESKELVIESLHRELLLHREGLHFRVLRPMFMDLITLYDDIGKLIDSIHAGSIPISDQVTQNLEIFLGTIEEILQRNGVEAFTSEEEQFLPNKQRCLKVIPTSDPAQDRHIARRVYRGFEYESKLLRHEIVEIYKYTPIYPE